MTLIELLSNQLPQQKHNCTRINEGDIYEALSLTFSCSIACDGNKSGSDSRLSGGIVAHRDSSLNEYFKIQLDRFVLILCHFLLLLQVAPSNATNVIATTTRDVPRKCHQMSWKLIATPKRAAPNTLSAERLFKSLSSQSTTVSQNKLLCNWDLLIDSLPFQCHLTPEPFARAASK